MRPHLCVQVCVVQRQRIHQPETHSLAGYVLGYNAGQRVVHTATLVNGSQVTAEACGMCIQCLCELLCVVDCSASTCDHICTLIVPQALKDQTRPTRICPFCWMLAMPVLQVDVRNTEDLQEYCSVDLDASLATCDQSLDVESSSASQHIYLGC